MDDGGGRADDGAGESLVHPPSILCQPSILPSRRGKRAAQIAHAPFFLAGRTSPCIENNVPPRGAPASHPGAPLLPSGGSNSIPSAAASFLPSSKPRRAHAGRVRTLLVEKQLGAPPPWPAHGAARTRGLRGVPMDPLRAGASHTNRPSPNEDKKGFASADPRGRFRAHQRAPGASLLLPFETRHYPARLVLRPLLVDHEI
jgi:hypothetical protein